VAVRQEATAVCGARSGSPSPRIPPPTALAGRLVWPPLPGARLGEVPLPSLGVRVPLAPAPSAPHPGGRRRCPGPGPEQGAVPIRRGGMRESTTVASPSVCSSCSHGGSLRSAGPGDHAPTAAAPGGTDGGRVDARTCRC